MDASLEANRRMFQPICKLMLIVPLVFAGALLAVRAALLHALPASDDVRRFLLPAPDCAMPCWQGIQPGVTTVDQASALLGANPWIEGLQIVERPPSTYLYWNWSNQKPAFVGDPRALIPPEIWAQNDTIQLIFIPTALAYGQVSLVLGRPHRGSFGVSTSLNSGVLDHRPNTHHLAAYFNGAVNVDTRIFCPVNLDLFWNAPVNVAYVGNLLMDSQSIFNYDLPRWLYGSPCNA